MYLYVLKQAQNKYYIGKTRYIKSRIQTHFMGYGTKWTQKFKPKSIYSIERMTHPFHEDVKTMEIMKLYGIDNVRGGSFSKVNLEKCDIYLLNKMIATSDDLCFICGSNKHHHADCPNK
tara:strand:- start:198 stop:554 length:357 start_codon:yes stop_codon:yes gene_type:complete